MKLVLLVLLTIVPAALASAVTLIEPTTLDDGRPLTFLDSCTAFWAAPDGTATGSQSFPATSSAGGGRHAVSIAGATEGARREVYGTCLRIVNGTEAVSARSTVLPVDFPVQPSAPPILVHP